MTNTRNRLERKNVEHEGDDDIIGILCAWEAHLSPGNKLKDLKILGKTVIIQATVLLRSATIHRRVLETSGDLLSLRLPWNFTN